MQVHQESKSLILKLRDPSRVTSVIPKARVVEVEGTPYTQVRFGLDEARVLRNLGIKAPSPIRYFYDWPSKYPCPMEHQVTTAEFFTLHQRGVCLNEMGLGKSLSALWGADFLMRHKVVNKALIVCPKSTMSSVWLDEVQQNFLSKRKAVVLHGSADRRRKLLAQDADFYIINHDGVKVIEADLAKRTDINLWIYDEASAVRNPQSERHKCLARSVRPTDWLWLLTGTPCPKEPTDVWGLAKLLGSKKVPHYFTAFRNQLMTQITQYKWVPKPGAFEMAYEALHPSIRFRKSDCLDLPPVTFTTLMAEMSKEQKAAYEAMKKELVAEVAGVQITAAHAATKLQKLLQISCLEYNTPVLTHRGWVPICDVTHEYKVWDGVEWVSQMGAKYMGDKPVVVLDGVTLTADHKVLTNSGWVTAGEILDGDASERLDRAKVRLPDGYTPGRHDNGRHTTRDVVVPVRLRNRGGAGEPELATDNQAERQPLRVPLGGVEQDTREVENAAVQRMGRDAAALHRPEEQGLAELRCAGDNGLRPMGDFRAVRSGHGADTQPGANTGARGQRRSIRTLELSVGDNHAAGQQPAHDALAGYTGGEDDTYTGRNALRGPERNAVWTAEEGVATGACASTPVYDLIECGPRNRFVVRGAQGQTMLVHNCGAVYDENGDVFYLDASERLGVCHELIEETSHNAIVFVPYTKALDMVAQHLRKHGHHVEVVDGRTSNSERKRIFTEFQNEPGQRVLVAHPATTAHGLTLTRADLTIWYGPITDLEIFAQANNRMDRPGQKNAMTVACLASNPLELELYSALKGKADMQNSVLGLFKSELGLPQN